MIDPERWHDRSCPACGVEQGEFHHQLCDYEECPACGKQLLLCSCLVEIDFVLPERLLPTWRLVSHNHRHTGISRDTRNQRIEFTPIGQGVLKRVPLGSIALQNRNNPTGAVSALKQSAATQEIPHTQSVYQYAQRINTP